MPKLRQRNVEDRQSLTVFDVTDVDGVCERVHVTNANTVIIQKRDSEYVQEKSFLTAVEALAYAINYVAWGSVVDELLDMSEHDEVRAFAKPH